MAYIQMNVMSESLMRTVNVHVILPADKLGFPGHQAHDARPYKTLYLLHGILGSQVDWVNGTNIQRWAEEYDLAVVMPAGENGFYVDHERSHNLYGTFIGQELPALCRKIFPLSEKREDTFIAGLSMGGYGALRNGLKYADTFGAIASLSTADVIPGIENRDNNSPLYFETRDYAEAVFGDLSSIHQSDKDLYYLAQQRKESGDVLPKLYLACGTSDSLLEANRNLHTHFQALGYDITYLEEPGAHEWDFWNRQIFQVLQWLPLSHAAAGVSSGNVGI